MPSATIKPFIFLSLKSYNSLRFTSRIRSYRLHRTWKQRKGEINNSIPAFTYHAKRRYVGQKQRYTKFVRLLVDDEISKRRKSERLK